MTARTLVVARTLVARTLVARTLVAGTLAVARRVGASWQFGSDRPRGFGRSLVAGPKVVARGRVIARELVIARSILGGRRLRRVFGGGEVGAAGLDRRLVDAPARPRAGPTLPRRWLVNARHAAAGASSPGAGLVVRPSGAGGRCRQGWVG